MSIFLYGYVAPFVFMLLVTFWFILSSDMDTAVKSFIIAMIPVFNFACMLIIALAIIVDAVRFIISLPGKFYRYFSRG